MNLKNNLQFHYWFSVYYFLTLLLWKMLASFHANCVQFSQSKSDCFINENYLCGSVHRSLDARAAKRTRSWVANFILVVVYDMIMLISLKIAIMKKVRQFDEVMHTFVARCFSFVIECISIERKIMRFHFMWHINADYIIITVKLLCAPIWKLTMLCNKFPSRKHETRPKFYLVMCYFFWKSKT